MAAAPMLHPHSQCDERLVAAAAAQLRPLQAARFVAGHIAARGDRGERTTHQSPIIYTVRGRAPGRQVGLALSWGPKAQLGVPQSNISMHLSTEHP